jgi:PAS domain S-box-containing protein
MKRWQSLAAVVAVLYAIVSILWISTSDLLVHSLPVSNTTRLALNMGKGYLFIAVTATALFYALRRLLRIEGQARAKAETTAAQLTELKAITEQSREFLYRHDAEGRFTYVGPQKQMIGYSVEELRVNWTSLLTDNPINQKAVEFTKRALLTGERQPPYLVEVRAKDGNPVLFEVDESPIQDSRGRVIGIAGAARDVTERERTQQALRQSEERFRQLAEAVSEVFWISSVDGNEVRYVSPAYEVVWGRSCDSLYRSPWTWCEAILPEDKPLAKKLFALEASGEVSVEYRIQRPDGSIRWILDRSFPLRCADGAVAGRAGIAKDCTERKQAEQALQKNERLYRTIFEAASDTIVILDNNHFSDCNDRALDMFGATREQLLGRTPVEFSVEVQPDGQRSQDKAVRLLDLVMKGRAQFFEWRHRRLDGSLFHAEVSLRRLEVGERMLALAVIRDITTRIQAEQALRESEEKLRSLYQSMSEGLALHEVVYDEKGEAVDYRILDVNPAFESLTGLERNQVVGNLASQTYASSPPPYLDIFAPVAQSGEPTAFESSYEPMGKHFAVSVFSPRKGQFATVFADISKRKEAEQQLCLLNQVYELISHINEAIVRIGDREMLFQEACRIAVEHGRFQMAWVGLLDEPTQAVLPVASAGRSEGYLAQVNATSCATPRGLGPVGTAVREGRVVVCQNIASDPAMAPWRELALERNFQSLIGLPLKINGKCIGVFAVYSSELHFFTAIVTESLIEVAADLSFALEIFERNHQREAEQQQLRLQHSALEAAANAIVITARDGSIQWVNDAFTRVTGYSRSEAIGQNPRVLRSGRQDAAFYRQMWETVLAGSVWQGALVNRRKDGSDYQEEMTITPVRSKAGEITHFIAIKQDVTERRKLEQQFLRAQRTQSIGLLAGGVAHDLNNVLAPVLMALPMLRGGLKPEQRDHLVDTLEQSVRRGANIVKQVLTFARGVEVQRTVVQIRHLVREVVKIAEETFPRDIQVRLSSPGNIWSLLGDPTQIHQVLLNLAVNARDAMPQGGQLSFTIANIELRHRFQFLDFEIPPGRYVSFSVQDTGTGISPEIIERMFEPFFTTKPAGKGTGLGLSTVLGIVRSHNGLVEVRSQPGLGSTFTVYLPAAPIDAPKEPAAHRVTPARGQGETILVVDDESGILEITQSTLESNGYKVLTAANGAKGLAIFMEKSQVIKAVVTDLMMPVMDGMALIRTLRKTSPTLPIIAATGLKNPAGDEDRTTRLQELGIKRILYKPFQSEELLTALDESLRNGA